MPKRKFSKVDLICKYCGKQWSVSYGLRHRQFCSNQCRGSYQYKNTDIGKKLSLNNHKRGKTHVELYGKDKADKISQILSESKTGDKNPSKRKDVRNKISESHKKNYDNGFISRLKGRTLSEERKAEISVQVKDAMQRPDVKLNVENSKEKQRQGLLRWHKENNEYFKECFNNPETKQKMRDSHIKAMRDGKYSNKSDTDIEKFVESYMKKFGWTEGKDYIKQYPYPEEHPKYLLDFYLPKLRLNIEAMGCYWHKCPECGYGPLRDVDIKRTKFMNDRDINVWNIWGHSMKNYSYEEFRFFVLERLMGCNVS